MNKSTRKVCATLKRLYKQKEEEYGVLIDGTWLPYDKYAGGWDADGNYYLYDDMGR